MAIWITSYTPTVTSAHHINCCDYQTYWQGSGVDVITYMCAHLVQICLKFRNFFICPVLFSGRNNHINENEWHDSLPCQFHNTKWLQFKKKKHLNW